VTPTQQFCWRAGPSDSSTGSGSVLGLAIAGGIVAILSLTLPLYLGLSIEQSIEGAADAAALAAADVASGIAPGSPCAVATEVATANGANLRRCAIDGTVVSVRAGRSFLGLQLSASATAGPPGAVTN
jgi:secretion/DNA translocation related TadE-like protein